MIRFLFLSIYIYSQSFLLAQEAKKTELFELRKTAFLQVIQANWLAAQHIEKIVPSFSPAPDYRRMYITPFLDCKLLPPTVSNHKEILDKLDIELEKAFKAVEALIQKDISSLIQSKEKADTFDFAQKRASTLSESIDNASILAGELREGVRESIDKVSIHYEGSFCKPNYINRDSTKQAQQGGAKATTPALILSEKAFLEADKAKNLLNIQTLPVTLREAMAYMAWVIELRNLRNTIAFFLKANNLINAADPLSDLKAPKYLAEKLNPKLQELSGFESPLNDQNHYQIPGFAMNFYRAVLFRPCNEQKLNSKKETSENENPYCYVDPSESELYQAKEIAIGKFKVTPQKTIGTYLSLIKNLATNFLFQEYLYSSFLVSNEKQKPLSPGILNKVDNPIVRLNIHKHKSGQYLKSTELFDIKLALILENLFSEMEKDVDSMKDLEEVFATSSSKNDGLFYSFFSFIEKNFQNKLEYQLFLNPQFMEKLSINHFLFHERPLIRETETGSQLAEPIALTLFRKSLTPLQYLIPKDCTLGDIEGGSMNFSESCIRNSAEKYFPQVVERFLSLVVQNFSFYTALKSQGKDLFSKTGRKENQSKERFDDLVLSEELNPSLLMDNWDLYIRNYWIEHLRSKKDFLKNLTSKILSSKFFKESSPWKFTEKELRDMVTKETTARFIEEENQYANERVRLFNTRNYLMNVQADKSLATVPSGQYRSDIPLIYQIRGRHPEEKNASLVTEYPFARPQPIGAPSISSKVSDHVFLKEIIKSSANNKIEGFEEKIIADILNRTPSLKKTIDQKIDASSEKANQLTRQLVDKAIESNFSSFETLKNIRPNHSSATHLLANNTVDTYLSEVLESSDKKSKPVAIHLYRDYFSKFISFLEKPTAKKSLSQSRKQKFELVTTEVLTNVANELESKQPLKDLIHFNLKKQIEMNTYQIPFKADVQSSAALSNLEQNLQKSLEPLAKRIETLNQIKSDYKDIKLSFNDEKSLDSALSEIEKLLTSKKDIAKNQLKSSFERTFYNYIYRSNSISAFLSNTKNSNEKIEPLLKNDAMFLIDKGAINLESVTFLFPSKESLEKEFPREAIIKKTTSLLLEAIEKWKKLSPEERTSKTTLVALLQKSIINPLFEGQEDIFTSWEKLHIKAVQEIKNKKTQEKDFLAKFKDFALKNYVRNFDYLVHTGVDLQLLQRLTIGDQAIIFTQLENELISLTQDSENILKNILGESKNFIKGLENDPFEKRETTQKALRELRLNLLSEEKEEKKLLLGKEVSILESELQFLDERISNLKNIFQLVEDNFPNNQEEVRNLLSLRNYLEQKSKNIFTQYIDTKFKNTQKAIDDKPMLLSPHQFEEDINTVINQEKGIKKINPSKLLNLIKETEEYCKAGLAQDNAHLEKPSLGVVGGMAAIHPFENKFNHNYLSALSFLDIPFNAKENEGIYFKNTMRLMSGIGNPANLLPAIASDKIYDKLRKKQIDFKLRTFWTFVSNREFNETNLKAFLNWVKENKGGTRPKDSENLPENINAFCKILHEKGEGLKNKIGTIKTIKDSELNNQAWNFIDAVYLIFFNFETEFTPLWNGGKMAWISSRPTNDHVTERSPIITANVLGVEKEEFSSDVSIQRNFDYLKNLITHLNPKTKWFEKELTALETRLKISKDKNEISNLKPIIEELKEFKFKIERIGSNSNVNGRLNLFESLFDFQGKNKVIDTTLNHYNKVVNSLDPIPENDQIYVSKQWQFSNLQPHHKNLRILSRTWDILRSWEYVGLIERSQLSKNSVAQIGLSFTKGTETLERFKYLVHLSSLLYKHFIVLSPFRIEKGDVKRLPDTKVNVTADEASLLAFITHEGKPLTEQTLVSLPVNSLIKLQQDWESKFKAIDTLITTYKESYGEIRPVQGKYKIFDKVRNDAFIKNYASSQLPNNVSLNSKEVEVLFTLEYLVGDPKDFPIREEEALDQDFYFYCNDMLYLGQSCREHKAEGFYTNWEYTGKEGNNSQRAEAFWEELRLNPIYNKPFEKIAEKGELDTTIGHLWSDPTLKKLSLKDIDENRKVDLKSQYLSLLKLHDQNSKNGMLPMTYGYFIAELSFLIDQSKPLVIDVLSTEKRPISHEEKAYLVKTLVDHLGIDLRDFSKWEALVFNNSKDTKEVSPAAWFQYSHLKSLSLNGNGQSFYSTSLPACKVGDGNTELFRPLPIIDSSAYTSFKQNPELSDAQYIETMKDPIRTDLYQIFTPTGLKNKEEGNLIEQGVTLVDGVQKDSTNPFHHRYVGLDIQHISFEDIRQKKLETNFKELKEKGVSLQFFEELNIQLPASVRKQVEATVLRNRNKEKAVQFFEKLETSLPSDWRARLENFISQMNQKNRELDSKEWEKFFLNDLKMQVSPALNQKLETLTTELNQVNTKFDGNALHKFIFEQESFNSLASVQNKYSQLRKKLSTYIKAYYFEEQSLLSKFGEANQSPHYYNLWLSKNVKKEISTIVETYVKHLSLTSKSVREYSEKNKFSDRIANFDRYLDIIYLADRYCGEITSEYIYGENQANFANLKKEVLVALREVYVHSAKEILYEETSSIVQTNVVSELEKLLEIEDFDSITNEEDLKRREKDVFKVAYYSHLVDLVFNEYDFVKENGRLPENAEKAYKFIQKLQKEMMEKELFRTWTEKWGGLSFLGATGTVFGSGYLLYNTFKNATWMQKLAKSSSIPLNIFQIGVTAFLGYLDYENYRRDFGENPAIALALQHSKDTKSAYPVAQGQAESLIDLKGSLLIDHVQNEIESQKWSYATWGFRTLMAPIYVGTTFKILSGASKLTRSLSAWAMNRSDYEAARFFKLNKDLLPEGVFGRQFSQEAAIHNGSPEALKERAIFKAISALEGDVGREAVNFSQNTRIALGTDLQKLRAELCKIQGVENNPLNFRPIKNLTEEELKSFEEILLPRLKLIEQLERKLLNTTAALTREEFHQYILLLGSNSSPLIRNASPFLRFLGFDFLFRSQTTLGLEKTQKIAQGYLTIMARFHPETLFSLAFLSTGHEAEVATFRQMLSSNSSKKYLEGPQELRDLHNQIYGDLFGGDIKSLARRAAKRPLSLNPATPFSDKELQLRKDIFEAVFSPEKHSFKASTSEQLALRTELESKLGLSSSDFIKVLELQEKVAEFYARRGLKSTEIVTYNHFFLESEGLILNNDIKRFFGSYEYVVQWHENYGKEIEKFAKIHGKSKEEVLKMMILEEDNILISQHEKLRQISIIFREQMSKNKWKPNLEMLRALSKGDYAGLANRLFPLP